LGICIYYQGSLNDPSRSGEALQDIRSFCESVGWPCKDFSEVYSGVAISTQEERDNPRKQEADPDEEPWPERPEGSYGPMFRIRRKRPPTLLEETVSGVYACPPNSESVRLVFDKTGRLVNYLDIPTDCVLNALPDTVHYFAFKHFVKICGDPVEHVAVCLLLKMLRDKHMSDLKVSDDTNFWNTWDFEELSSSHAQMGALIGAVQKSFESGALLKALGVDVGEGKLKLLDTKLPGMVREKPKAATARVH